MSEKGLALRGPGRSPLRFWCDCAEGMAEHSVMAAVRDDPPREGELLAIKVRCLDCGNEVTMEAQHG